MFQEKNNCSKLQMVLVTKHWSKNEFDYQVWSNTSARNDHDSAGRNQPHRSEWCISGFLKQKKKLGCVNSINRQLFTILRTVLFTLRTIAIVRKIPCLVVLPEKWSTGWSYLFQRCPPLIGWQSRKPLEGKRQRRKSSFLINRPDNDTEHKRSDWKQEKNTLLQSLKLDLIFKWQNGFHNLKNLKLSQKIISNSKTELFQIVSPAFWNKLLASLSLILG